MIVRRISNGSQEIGRSVSKALFLTFDDGPDPVSTPRILDILLQEQVPSTFFVVAKKAERERKLLERILADGHAIGNHSLDHAYGAFFGSQQKMNDWVWESESAFSQLLVEPVGFRPPAGIVTPPLKRALKAKGLPLVLWQTRFYDTNFQWTPKKAESSLVEAQAGDIVLLHDRQKLSRLEIFSEALVHYIRTARSQGFTFERLTADLCKKQSLGSEN